MQLKKYNNIIYLRAYAVIKVDGLFERLTEEKRKARKRSWNPVPTNCGMKPLTTILTDWSIYGYILIKI